MPALGGARRKRQLQGLARALEAGGQARLGQMSETNPVKAFFQFVPDFVLATVQQHRAETRAKYRLHVLTAILVLLTASSGLPRTAAGAIE